MAVTIRTYHDTTLHSLKTSTFATTEQVYLVGHGGPGYGTLHNAIETDLIHVAFLYASALDR